MSQKEINNTASEKQFVEQTKMPESMASAQHTLEQENNAMLKEVLRHVRFVRRIYTTSFIITITFIVLPVILAAFVLPQFISTFVGSYSEYAKDVGITPSGNIFDMFKQLQDAQSQLNSTNQSQ